MKQLMRGGGPLYRHSGMCVGVFVGRLCCTGICRRATVTKITNKETGAICEISCHRYR